MLFESQTADYLAIIRRGAMSQTMDIIESIKREARRFKPAAFDSEQVRRRAHYEGRGKSYVQGLLARLYPRTHQYMQPSVLNWAKLYASTAAAVYDDAVTRELLELDGTPLEADNERTVAFAALLEGSGITTTMPEAERRSKWAGDQVIMVRARKTYDVDAELVTRIALDLHWAHDCWAVPHPSAPSDWQMLVAFAVRVSCAGEASGDETWEAWTRACEDDPQGRPLRFGPWMVNIVSREGYSTPLVEYAGKRLPALLLRDGIPAGGPWFDPGSDDVDYVEALSAQMTDRNYLTSQQAHTDKVYVGSKLTLQSEIPMGPDSCMMLDDGESLTTLDYNPKLDQMREGERENLRRWAMTKRQSMDAYSADSASPASGIARQIQNEPQSKARAEAVHALRQFEVTMLLPTMVEAHDLFVEGTAIGPCRYSFEPSGMQDFEEPEARQRRAVDAKDAGLISEARAGVMAGLYPSIDEAIAAGLDDEVKRSNSLASDGGGFAARMAASPPEVETDEPEAIEPTEAVAVDVPAADLKDKAKADALAADPQAAFNGAQVAALVDVVKAVVAGELPRESAVQIITVAFPVDAAQADALLGEAGKGFKPPVAEAAPAPPFASQE